MQASAAPGPSPSPSDRLSWLRPGLLTRFNHCHHVTENPSHRITYTRANVYLPNNHIDKNDYYPLLEKRKQTQKSWATNMSQSQHLKSSLSGADLRSLYWMELPFGPQLTIWIYGSWDSFSFVHLFNKLFICFIEVCLIYKKLHTSNVYILMSLDIWLHLWYPHHDQSTNMFLTSKDVLVFFCAFWFCSGENT